MFPLFLGFFLSLTLLSMAIWQQDGFSVLATVLLSLLTTLIGWGNKWTLRLTQRAVKDGYVPGGDVVIRYPKGSFLVVRCNENVARELYFAPETMDYLMTHGMWYRILSLVGTMMLMGGVICLANAQIELQIAWAGSYMVLGTSYWIVAALPPKLHWDTSAYAVENECLTDSDMSNKAFPSLNKTYTQALWKAILLAKGRTEWVGKSNACPDTRVWERWLQEARDEARKLGKEARAETQYKSKDGRDVVTWQVPDWKPQEALNALLAEQAQADAKEMGEGIEEV